MTKTHSNQYIVFAHQGKEGTVNRLMVNMDTITMAADAKVGVDLFTRSGHALRAETTFDNLLDAMATARVNESGIAAVKDLDERIAEGQRLIKPAHDGLVTL